MGTFGFSYVGLVFLLLLFIPNAFWAKNQPTGYSAQNESKVLRLFECVGQIAVCSIVLVFSDFNIKTWSIWSLWLVAAFLVMVLYECWWIRYFKSAKTLRDFHSSFFGVPLAGATLPVIAFFLLSVYGRVPLLSIAALVLGIGHIGIHIQHAKELDTAQ